MAFRSLKRSNPLLAGYFEPEMMAIGDSLYNGVRSLTLTGSLAALSAPARVAQGLGLAFRAPDYPWPVLMDLEEELRHVFDLKRIRAHIIANGHCWQSGTDAWSMTRFFDNISIAGADYEDLNQCTAGKARTPIPTLLAALEQNSSLNFSIVADLFFAINVAFVLNPTRHPELDDLTPLEQVASRSPKRLLINIGSNEGLFTTGLHALCSEESIRKIEQIPEKAEALATLIRQYCPGTKRIYFNLLVRPRVLANLAPRSDSEFDITPGESYFERYIGRIGGLNGITATEMEDIDSTVMKVNALTVSKMERIFSQCDQSITFINLFSLSDNLDGKHFGRSRMLQIDNGRRIMRYSNLPFESNIAGFQHGGLFSLDNLHLSSLGYAVMANFVGDAIAACERVSYARISMDRALSEDTLLRDPPRHYDMLTFLGGFAGLLGVDSAPLG